MKPEDEARVRERAREIVEIVEYHEKYLVMQEMKRGASTNI